MWKFEHDVSSMINMCFFWRDFSIFGRKHPLIQGGDGQTKRVVYFLFLSNIVLGSCMEI